MLAECVEIINVRDHTYKRPSTWLNTMKVLRPSLSITALCFSVLLSSVSLPAMASEPTTGTLIIIISSVGGWLALGLLPFVFRLFMKKRALRKSMAEME